MVKAANFLPGTTFGRLTIQRKCQQLFNPDGSTYITWVCLCSCGKFTEARTRSLTSGATQSCGCLQKETTTKRSTIHGKSKRGLVTKTYMVWASMIRRCNNPNAEYYRYYGGRGIKVCPRWHKFENFYADVGDIPRGMSLDRKDNDGDYEPGNWRFATWKEQNNNSRNNHWIKYKGEEKTLTQWGEVLGINMHTLLSRLNQLGWSIERAFTTPVRGF